MTDPNEKVLQELLKKDGNGVCADCRTPSMCTKLYSYNARLFIICLYIQIQNGHPTI